MGVAVRVGATTAAGVTSKRVRRERVPGAVEGPHPWRTDMMETTPHYLFVGEKRSSKAIASGWSWQDGRLAGKTLLDALEACGLSRTVRRFRIVNAFYDDGHENTECRDLARQLAAERWIIIGMGDWAQRALTFWGIPYRAMIHPAARGAIRKRERYHAHVAAVLASPTEEAREARRGDPSAGVQ